MIQQYSRTTGKAIVSLGSAAMYVGTAVAYHGTEHGSGAPTVSGSLSGTELMLFYILPILAVSVALYPIIQRRLVDRYAGESVVKPNPRDMRKYSVISSATIAAVLAITAAITIGAQIGHTAYAVGVGVFVLAAVVFNREWIRSRITA